MALDPKHMFRYTVGGAAAARLASMRGEGPLFVGPQHFLATTLQNLLPTPAAAGNIIVNNRMVEYVLSDVVRLAPNTADKSVLWFLELSRSGQFFADADALGVSWAKVTAATMPAALDKLRNRMGALAWPDDQRTVNDSELVDGPTVPGFASFITNSAILGEDASLGALLQLRAMLHGHYTTASAGSATAAALRMMLAALAGPTIAGLPDIAVAAKVTARLRATMQPSGYVHFLASESDCFNGPPR